MNDLERHLLEELADDPQGVVYSNSAKETVAFDELTDQGFAKRDSGDRYQITNAGLRVLGLERCPSCDGYGFDVDADIFDEKGELQAEKCLTCEGKGCIKAQLSEPESPEYDADKAECQHEIALDNLEAERDLKAYRAEHDDAPDPQPVITEIPTDADGNPIYTKQPRRSFYNEDYDPYAAVHNLQAQLAAVTAERDKLRAALEAAFKKADSYWEQLKYVEREKQWGHLSGGLLETVEIIQSALDE